MELILQIWIITLVVNAVRSTRIPSPLQGIAGFNHFKLTEVQDQTFFTYVFMFSQRNFITKLLYTIERLGRCVHAV